MESQQDTATRFLFEEADIRGEIVHLDAAYRDKILGPDDKSKKGYEEEVFDKLKEANADLKADAEHEVVLPSNIFAKKKPGDMSVDEMNGVWDFVIASREALE